MPANRLRECWEAASKWLCESYSKQSCNCGEFRVNAGRVFCCFWESAEQVERSQRERSLAFFKMTADSRPEPPAKCHVCQWSMKNTNWKGSTRSSRFTRVLLILNVFYLNAVVCWGRWHLDRTYSVRRSWIHSFSCWLYLATVMSRLWIYDFVLPIK